MKSERAGEKEMGGKCNSLITICFHNMNANGQSAAAPVNMRYPSQKLCTCVPMKDYVFFLKLYT